jgi:hypothetical protein
VIVWGIRHFHHYLSRPFSIVTDHSALKWLQTSKMPKGRRARWIMELQQYTFTIQHRPGKSNANADALSRMYDDETECFFLEFQETEEPEEVPESSYTFSTTSQWYTAQGPSTQEFMLETDSETEEEKPYQLRLRYDPERPQFRFEPISGANPDQQRVVHIQYDSQGEEIEEEERSQSSGDTYQWYEQYESDQYDDNVWEPMGDPMAWLNCPQEKRKFQEEENANYVDYPGLKLTKVQANALFEEGIVEKHVVANQPLRKGGSKCTEDCDTEQHHTHNYCRTCKRNLPYWDCYNIEEYLHDCVVGFGPGKIHFDMNPDYLINEPWWEEPAAVIADNHYTQLRKLYKIFMYYLHTPMNQIPFYFDFNSINLDFSPVIAELD